MRAAALTAPFVVAVCRNHDAGIQSDRTESAQRMRRIPQGEFALDIQSAKNSVNGGGKAIMNPSPTVFTSCPRAC